MGALIDPCATPSASVRLAVPDAEIHFTERLAFAEPPEALLQQLITTVPWRAESIVVWGKKHLQPRLVAWYGDPGSVYTYSGLSLTPLAWTETLSAIRRVVETVAAHSFNSVLLNYYRDERDSMGFHSDDEPELGPHPVIASLSLGATRTFVLKHKGKGDVENIRLKLPSGSLLVMQGDTQQYWAHGIPKQGRPCGPRVNLTFRQVLQTR